jgi:hypothetical protein
MPLFGLLRAETLDAEKPLGRNTVENGHHPAMQLVGE